MEILDLQYWKNVIRDNLRNCPKGTDKITEEQVREYKHLFCGYDQPDQTVLLQLWGEIQLCGFKSDDSMKSFAIAPDGRIRFFSLEEREHFEE